MKKNGRLACGLLLWSLPASRRTIVMIAFLSFSRLARCFERAEPRFIFDTRSPNTSTKSPVIRFRLSRSLRASPTEAAGHRRIVSLENGDVEDIHLEFLYLVLDP